MPTDDRSDGDATTDDRSDGDATTDDRSDGDATTDDWSDGDATTEDDGGSGSLDVRRTDVEGDALPTSERFADLTDRFLHAVELIAAAVFAVLFAVGVGDLVLQIVSAVLSGRITDPLVVIGFIDTGLLLLIIVEVYETVIAYTEESDTRRIVRLVIYTGVIAMVRKAIIFRTGEYATAQDALFAAVAYTVLLLGLAGILLVEQAYGDRLSTPF